MHRRTHVRGLHRHREEARLDAQARFLREFDALTGWRCRCSSPEDFTARPTLCTQSSGISASIGDSRLKPVDGAVLFVRDIDGSIDRIERGS